MKIIALAPLFYAASALPAAIDIGDWGTTLDEFLPNVASKRSNLPHLDTFEDQEAFEVFADGETTDVSINSRSTGTLFDTLAARQATCSCPAGYKSCCPKWDRCFKPPKEQITCCKVKTGTVACKKPKSCCYNGCVRASGSLPDNFESCMLTQN